MRWDIVPNSVSFAIASSIVVLNSNMSFIVTSILSSTVGLLWNKARDSTAAKLKDGDVMDAKIREIVIRELNDIKTKLDVFHAKIFSAAPDS